MNQYTIMTILTKIEKTKDRTNYYQKFGEEWLIHREDGPAVVHADGKKEWYLEGDRHRKDGPAVEFPNGGKQWYFEGKRHHEDGPAIEYANGDKSWYFKGKRHREDGPAVEWGNGKNEYFLNGKEYSKEEYDKEMNKNKHSDKTDEENESNENILSKQKAYFENLLEKYGFQESIFQEIVKIVELERTP